MQGRNAMVPMLNPLLRSAAAHPPTTRNPIEDADPLIYTPGGQNPVFTFRVLGDHKLMHMGVAQGPEDALGCRLVHEYVMAASPLQPQGLFTIRPLWNGGIHGTYVSSEPSAPQHTPVLRLVNKEHLNLLGHAKSARPHAVAIPQASYHL